jgi:hypothetical protein
MFADSGWGFAVWRSMLRGARFNWLVQANAQDIAQDSGGFLATWTPGQYVIPGLLTYGGLSLGDALTVVTAVSSGIGLFGWYKVYRALGFSNAVAWVSCGLIVFSRFFVLPFGIYNGGEVLLFGGAPYVFLAGLWAVNGSWRPLALIPVFLAAFFLKNAALILALAICTALVFADWSHGSGRLARCARWPLIFAATYALAYVLYTSRGWTPMMFEARIADQAIGKGLFAFAAPLLSAFSVDDGLSWLLLHPGRQVYLDWQFSLPMVLPLAIAACVSYRWAAREHAPSLYPTFLLAFLVTYVLVFAALNVLGSPVSSTTEVRHSRPAGLLLLPGLVAAAMTTPRRALRIGCCAIGLIACAYGLASYVNKWHYTRSLDAVGTQGFTQTSIDAAALRWLVKTDAGLEPGTSVFYLTSPELALEIAGGRVILTHADFEVVEILAARAYCGVVDNLFVVLPERFVASGKARVILDSFRDYEGWSSLEVGDSRVYTGYPVSQPLDGHVPCARSAPA